LKARLFLFVSACIMVVIAVDESLLMMWSDPEWAHIAPVEGQVIYSRADAEE
jgi:hypothetical protein